MEKRTVFQGLYPKLVLTVGILFIVAVLVILGSMYVAESQAIERSGLMQAETLNRMAFEALYASMRQGGERAGNQEVIDRLRADGAFKTLRVVKGDAVAEQFGASSAELPQNELELRALTGEAATDVVLEDGHRVVRYATPLVMREECAQCHNTPLGDVNGVISTSISLEALDAELRERRNYLLRVVGGMLVLLLVAVFFAIQRLVIAPVQTIQRGTAAIAAGVHDHPLAVKTGDELEALAGEINHMVGQLDETHAEIIEEQNKLIASIQSSHDAIWISDADRRIVMVNPALERLIGRAPGRAVGTKLPGSYGAADVGWRLSL